MREGYTVKAKHFHIVLAVMGNDVFSRIVRQRLNPLKVLGRLEHEPVFAKLSEPGPAEDTITVVGIDAVRFYVKGDITALKSGEIW